MRRNSTIVSPGVTARLSSMHMRSGEKKSDRKDSWIVEEGYECVCVWVCLYVYTWIYVSMRVCMYVCFLSVCV